MDMVAVKTSSETNTLIQLSNVSKVFDNGVTALKNVHLAIKEGEFVSFVGPSGCGKSTIFKIIAGLSEPTSGTVELQAHSATEKLDQSDIGFVFQHATLLPWRSVIDNVALPLELKRIGKRERRKQAKAVLNLVGLNDYETSLPRQLSGGMQMRVSIARALIAKPKLLLMDEPFGALDEITRQTMHYELLKIWEKTNMTVLFITHNVFESVFLSTRIAVMSARPGRVTDVLDVPDYEKNDSFRSTPEFSKLVGEVSKGLQHE
nr:ABC transporter ATP-binding protein [Bacillus sp. Marseille-P3800]